MKLETAHILLISTAILFFLVLALFECTRWWSGQGTSALLGAAVSAGASAVFAIYLRSFVKGLKSS